MIKFSIALALCLLYRLNPYRMPNMTPILALGLPFGKLNKTASFLFCALSILIYDLITAPAYFDIGETIVKMSCYGITGLIGAAVLEKRSPATYWKSVFLYGGISIAGIIFFDAACVILMAIRHPESFALILLGQIEYTGYHLLSVLFVPFAPLVQRWIVENKKFEFDAARIS